MRTVTGRPISSASAASPRSTPSRSCRAAGDSRLAPAVRSAYEPPTRQPGGFAESRSRRPLGKPRPLFCHRGSGRGSRGGAGSAQSTTRVPRRWCMSGTSSVNIWSRSSSSFGVCPSSSWAAMSIAKMSWRPSGDARWPAISSYSSRSLWLGLAPTAAVVRSLPV